MEEQIVWNPDRRLVLYKDGTWVMTETTQDFIDVISKGGSICGVYVITPLGAVYGDNLIDEDGNLRVDGDTIEVDNPWPRRRGSREDDQRGAPPQVP